ncbi:MAG: hypothetical protein GF307_12500, partial [candidate division Zixibacteria bacterium]|nr:hypothetical protein [candidate division Zixibacteria bacterium]
MADYRMAAATGKVSPHQRRGSRMDHRWRLTIFIATIALTATCCLDCNKGTDGGEEFVLKLENEFILAVPEPSGLALDIEDGYLWTVSDETNRVYRLTTTGQITDSLSYRGADLEGVTVSTRDSTIWIVEERSREIVHLDRSGNELGRISLDTESNGNNGLEGISFDPGTGRFFIVNEKEPRLLIELDEQLSVIGQYALNFSADVSGLCYDVSNNCLWIVSDQSRLLAKCRRDG